MSHSGRAWRVLVPVTALCAGLLFAASAATAQGTDLRAGRVAQLTDLVRAQQREVARREVTATALRRQVAGGSAVAARSSQDVAAAQRGSAVDAAAAGLGAVAGPAVTVTLDDAPRPPDGTPAASDNPDDLVIHQQDVQSVVNALWAGGAEAMTIMGERVVSTSAIRCVGNTLLVQGALVGPPFVITAIGDRSRMSDALAVEPGVALLRQYVDAFGVRLSTTRQERVLLPTYAGPLDLPHVRVP